MDELSAALKIVLSNTFVMYQKAQIYHWNVEGPMFAQYHDFFADIYADSDLNDNAILKLLDAHILHRELAPVKTY